MSLFSKSKNDIPRRRINVGDVTMDAELSNSFKRNQTLAGPVPSQSPRVKTHHLAIKRRKVFAVFVIVLLGASFMWILINNFTAKVTVKMSSPMISKNIDKTIYEKTIQEYLDDNPLGRFRFLLDQSSLNTFMISKLPEINGIKQMNVSGLGETSFEINTRTPVAGWVIDSRQHFVDANGISFDKNYSSPPSVQIIDQSGVSAQTGSAVVSQRFLGFVGRVVAQSVVKGYTVTQAIIPPSTTRELEIRIKEGDYLVKLSIDRPVGEQIEDMAVALKYFTDRVMKPQYIDVRVSGKAFYL